MLKEYQTVNGEISAEFVEKRSRFLAIITRVSGLDEINSFICKLKQKHRDARHHVYAYILQKNNLSRYSDDGEPQGSAGLPVLKLISKNKLLDCIIVVVRYFGGILLGTGRLAHAYQAAAQMAIDEVKIVNMYFCYDLVLFCDYTDYGKINRLISEMGHIDGTLFLEDIKFSFHIKIDDFERFCKKLSDLTKGAVVPKIVNEGFKPMEP
jgi:uncharacterized YigZ family protein